MISIGHGKLTLDNVGRFYFLKCLDMNLAELQELFQNIHNFYVVSISLSGIYKGDELFDKDVKLTGKGVKDCLDELVNYVEFEDVSAEELSLVNLQILWYDEVVE